MIRVAKGFLYSGIFLTCLTFWALVAYRNAIIFWLLVGAIALVIGMIIIIQKFGRYD